MELEISFLERDETIFSQEMRQDPYQPRELCYRRGQSRPPYAPTEQENKYITDEVIEQLRSLEHVKSANPVLNISALALKGKYIGYLDIYGMTPEELETRNIELLPGGRLPDPDSTELEFVFGNMVITNFYEEKTGRGYWDTGEAPDIDLANDKIFLILDQDGYYASQSSSSMGVSEGEGGEGGSAGPTRAPKKYVVHASGIVAGSEEEYNNNSYSVCTCIQYKILESIASRLKRTSENFSAFIKNLYVRFLFNNKEFFNMASRPGPQPTI